MFFLKTYLRFVDCTNFIAFLLRFLYCSIMTSTKHKVSWLNGSMEEVIGELDENAFTHQIPLSPDLNSNGK